MTQGVAQAKLDRAAQKRYAATRPTNLVPPRVFVNNTSPGLLTPIRMGSPREDADANLLCPSVVMGALVKRQRG